MADERVTIVDVARRAGVAISSVSSALNGRPGVSEATRQRIVQAAAELGFTPSLRGRSLSGRRAWTVGLVVHRDPDVLELDPFYGGFVGGVEDAIDARGYALVLQLRAGPQDALLDRYRRLAADRRVDGVLLTDLAVDDRRVPLVADLGLPAVAVNPAAGVPVPAVRQEAGPGIRAVLRHLVALGHRSIGFVGGSPGMTHSDERERAWAASMAETGLPSGPVATGDFTYAGGERAASVLLAGDSPPTAVLCANDLSALGFVARAEQLGLRVPSDVSVAGFDDTRLGQYVRPTLTTVHTDPRLLGREAGRMLLDLVETGRVDDVRVPDAALVVRESTGVAAR